MSPESNHEPRLRLAGEPENLPDIGRIPIRALVGYKGLFGEALLEKIGQELIDVSEGIPGANERLLTKITTHAKP